MKPIIYLIGQSLLIMMSCNPKSHLSKCNIYQTNLESTESFTHCISDDTYCYLIGAIAKDMLDYRTREIYIKKAVVGNEENWSMFVQRIPGKCQAVNQTEKYIYLISRQQYQERQDPKYSKHKLYRISKESGSIIELNEWNEGNLIFGELYFYSDEIGYVFLFSHNTSTGQLVRTIDGGKKWEVVKTKVAVSPPKYLSGSVHFVSSKKIINSINREGVVLDSLQYDLKLTDFAVSEDGEYWLLGKDRDRTALQHYKDGKTTEVKTFSEDADFSPTQLYKYHDVIVVLAGKVDKSMLGGFGGTKPAMYISKDNGLTWINQTLNEALYLKPVSFYKDERMTAYIGLGKVLTCSLK